MSTISFRNLADNAPSTRLWSVVRLRFIMGRTTTSLFMAIGLSIILFMPKIATSGLLINRREGFHAEHADVCDRKCASRQIIGTQSVCSCIVD